jgi:hypothetical protein
MITLPFLQATSKDTRPDTSNTEDSLVKLTIYVRVEQLEAYKDVFEGAERHLPKGTPKRKKIDFSSLGRAMIETCLDMAHGLDPLNHRETPQEAILRRIKSESEKR